MSRYVNENKLECYGHRLQCIHVEKLKTQLIRQRNDVGKIIIRTRLTASIHRGLGCPTLQLIEVWDYLVPYSFFDLGNPIGAALLFNRELVIVLDTWNGDTLVGHELHAIP